MAMSISKFLGFLLLIVGLFISSTVAQSPAPSPSGGGRRITPSPKKSPAPETSPSPKTASPTPESALSPSTVDSPPTPPQAVSPSAESPSITPSSISTTPTQAPAPAQSDAVSNRYAVFGSIAVVACAVVLAM